MGNKENYMISILGSHETPGDPAEQFELTTEGSFLRRRGIAEISYIDSDTTGFAGAKTTFLVEPDRITLTRDSWYGGDMVFDEREKHHFLYQTPYGSLTMGIATEKMASSLDAKGGSLYIKYALDVDNVVISRNTFDISVKPA